MTPKFESHNHNQPYFQKDWLTAPEGDDCEHSTDATNPLERDCFELLSAYLDGEVTAAERRQVEEWLATDLSSQRLYRQLVNLRQGLRTMPVPPPQQSAERTAQEVFTRLHNRPKWTAIWGGTALAAMLVGALSGNLPNRQSLLYQMVRAPQPITKPETIMVALNTPVVDIPKAPAAAPEKSVKPVRFPQQTNQFY